MSQSDPAMPDANRPFDQRTEPPGDGVICAKCGQLSSGGSRRCIHCDSHLHVFCYACGYENLRASQECSECGTHLHTKHRRHHQGMAIPSRPFSMRRIQAVALLVGLAIALMAFTQGGMWFETSRNFLVPAISNKPDLQEAPPEAFLLASIFTGIAFVLLPLGALVFLASLNKPRPTRSRFNQT